MNLKRLKNYLVITLLALVSISASAETSASAIEAKKQILFNSAKHESTPYRIPAIATLKNGNILAISDQRPCGADIGNGEVDIYAKVSKDNGKTWIPSSTDPSADRTGLKIAEGTGNTSSWDCGFGDAAVVVDRESGDVLVICVAGSVKYADGSSSKHNKMARIRATFNESTGELSWGSPDDVTKAFFDELLPKAYTMFMASGRMIQSTKVKVGSHYRVYGALLVKNEGNYVVYSDNFGETWNLLGGACCPSGDEAKVEELPNGDILLSSRTYGGRYYNVYTYSDKTNWSTGSWEGAKECGFEGSNSTNGELLLYKGVAKSNDITGTKYNVLLQSLPIGERTTNLFGSEKYHGREDVCVYYKVISEKDTYKVSDFTSDWKKGIHVEEGPSAYSTMTIMPNGEIAFLYEDDYDTSKASGGYSDIIFVPLTVSEITGGAYSYVEETTVEETVATPTFTPNGGELKYGNNTVTITCETADATIYYTTDGTTPTASSTKYTGAFTLTSNATVKAIAVKDGWTDSEVASVSFTYTVETVATPTFTPNGGEIEAGTMIAISCATEGATIYYSIDGGEPTTVYSAPFALNNAATVKAVAKKEGWNNSATAQASFTIKQEVVVEIVATPVIAPNGGEIEAGTTISISCATEGATIYYSIDGTEPTEEYSAPFALTEATTVMAIAVKDGWNDSDIATALFTIKVEEPEEVNSWTVTPQVGVSGVLRRYYAMFSADKPFELPNGVTAYYVVKANSIYVTIMKVPAFKTIPANQGVILRSMIKSKYNPYTITATDNTSNLADLSDNLLSHTANGEKTIAESESIYCLGYQDGTKLWKFNKAEAGTIIPQNSAYIDLSAVSLNVLSIDIADDSEVSGIEDVNAEDAEVEYYNLQGVKVGNPEKGIYIMKQGGKTSKVVL